jgi:hypothetical protein
VVIFCGLGAISGSINSWMESLDAETQNCKTLAMAEFQAKGFAIKLM